MGGYRILPHTAEVGLRISGKTWEEFYQNAARGLLAIYGIRGPRGPRDMKAALALKEETPEDLLVSWLNELIYHVSAHYWIPTYQELRLAGANSIKATLAGPRVGKRQLKTEIRPRPITASR